MGKKYYNLYSRLCHPLNLWEAYRKAARGKRSQPAAAAFEYNLEEELVRLAEELRQGSYRPGAADGSLRRGALPAGGNQRQPDNFV